MSDLPTQDTVLPQSQSPAASGMGLGSMPVPAAPKPIAASQQPDTSPGDAQEKSPNEPPPYVKRIMALEGGGKDPRSTAVGGFLDQTWLTLVRENVPAARDMPDDQVLAQRADPVLRAQMVAAYARDNAMTLQHAGHPVDETNLRLAHWFGAGGANRILSASPDTPVDKIFSPDVIAANPSLAGKNAGQVRGMAAEQMSGTTLQHQWTQDIPPELRDAFAYSKDARSRLDSLQSEYQKLAAQPVAGGAERRERIAHLEGEIDQATKDWESLAKQPPIQKPTDMWQNFGSAATIVALLGGLLARNHMTAGLNAAGMAMQAITSNNKEQFQQQFKTWQLETQYGLDQIKLKSSEIDRVLHDQKLSIDEKLAGLHSITELAGMTEHSASLAKGDLTTFVLLQNGLNKGAAAATNNAMTLDKWNRYQQAVQVGIDALPPEHRTEANILAIQNKAAADAGLPGAKAPTGSAGREAEIERAVKTADEKFRQDHPDASQTEIDAAHTASRLKVEKDFAQVTRTPRSAPAMFMQKYMEEHPEATATEMSEAAADFRRMGAIETGFASGILGRQVLSLNTVADHLLLVREYGEALKNGQIPRANAIANRVAVELGKPEVTNFEAGRDIMADEVVRLLTTTGGTESDRQGMQTRLGSSMSPAQMSGALNVFGRFVSGRFEALEQQYAGNDPARRKRFETDLLTDKSREVFVSGKEAAAPAASKAVPSDLPSPAGHPDGYVARDGAGNIVAKIVGGQWAAP